MDLCLTFSSTTTVYASWLLAAVHKERKEFASNVHIMLHLEPVIYMTYLDTVLLRAGMHYKASQVFTVHSAHAYSMYGTNVAADGLSHNYVKSKISGEGVQTGGSVVPSQS